MAQALSIAGARYNGGPVSAGGLYQVGEKGKPEIYQASTGKQYMIPGDNGKVISNKDMNGGQVQVNIQFYDQTSGGQHSFQAQASQEGGVVTVKLFLPMLIAMGNVLCNSKHLVSEEKRKVLTKPTRSGGFLMGEHNE
jgi:hypothetical protein